MAHWQLENRVFACESFVSNGESVEAAQRECSFSGAREDRAGLGGLTLCKVLFVLALFTHLKIVLRIGMVP